MPTDLTALREAWERDHAINLDYHGNRPAATPELDDLARRAYDAAVADCEEIVQSVAEDTPEPDQFPLAVAIARLATLKGGK